MVVLLMDKAMRLFREVPDGRHNAQLNGRGFFRDPLAGANALYFIFMSPDFFDSDFIMSFFIGSWASADARAPTDSAVAASAMRTMAFDKGCSFSQL